MSLLKVTACLWVLWFWRRCSQSDAIMSADIKMRWEQELYIYYVKLAKVSEIQEF